MNANAELITRFYTSFQNNDHKGMQACYADNAHFNDPVFTNLDAKKTKAMWEMLLRNGKDLHLEFNHVTANKKNGSADWIATYTFSKTGRKVINSIRAEFEFEQGKIIRHSDYFNFYKWARQALGLSGLMLGWTPFIKNKIRTAAMRNLHQFMSKQAG
jgi:ketosteroid isomerase-like protein